MIRTVLFDLDGTLLDTAPDLAYALNRVREEQGAAALPFERIRPAASHGTAGLLRLGFDLGSGDDGFEPLRRRLLDIYQDHLACETRLFPGMEPLLNAIDQRGMQWGVVTNKPSWLTEPLMKQLGLSARSACIVSGDTTARRKPDPEPVLRACRLTGCEPNQCVYVGDAERDIAAGRSAGMPTLVACYGYLGAEDRPAEWGANGLVQEPMQILAWLDGQTRAGGGRHASPGGWR